MSRRRSDLVLVAGIHRHIGNEQLPHARRHEMPHRVHAPVPAIEVANHAHALRIGRPYGEVNAGDATDRHCVRAELLPRAQVRALAEQMEVVVRQDLTELIGIGDLARASVFMRAESIREIRRASLEWQPRLEQAVRMPARHRRDLPVGDQLHRRRRRLHRPHDHCGTLINRDDMTTEDGERITARPGCHLDDALVLDRLQNACHEKIVSRRTPVGG